MSEVVERVARAICCPNRACRVGCEVAKDYEPQARAAIEALREPTGAMLKVAGDFGEEWQAMISAALSEPVQAMGEKG